MTQKIFIAKSDVSIDIKEGQLFYYEKGGTVELIPSNFELVPEELQPINADSLEENDFFLDIENDLRIVGGVTSKYVVTLPVEIEYTTETISEKPQLKGGPDVSLIDDDYDDDDIEEDDKPIFDTSMVQVIRKIREDIKSKVVKMTYEQALNYVKEISGETFNKKYDDDDEGNDDFRNRYLRRGHSNILPYLNKHGQRCVVTYHLKIDDKPEVINKENSVMFKNDEFYNKFKRTSPIKNKRKIGRSKRGVVIHK